MIKQKRQKITMDIVMKYCEENNLKCLEEKYVNSNTSMRWECLQCNHIRKTNFYELRKKGRKCEVCYGKKLGFKHEEVVEHAKKKGCKPTEPYVRSDISMGWECLECNYQWKTSFSNITRENSKRCPKCNGNRKTYTIEEVKEIVKNKNMACLNDTYEDCNKQMDFKCLKCDREWKTTFRSVVQNIGCLKCNHKEKTSHTMKFILERIKNKPFTCVSSDYINTKTHMEWKCNVCCNIWKSTFGHIHYYNTGCPNCRSWKSEKMCRENFQAFLGHNFPSVYLNSMDGLQLDGYCKELNLAFEYQGKQHYEHIPYFQPTEEDFKRQQERDKRKKELCVENGIELIEVPWEYDYRDSEKMENYICKKLVETGFLTDVFSLHR